jgi:hypothetical protein
VCASGGSNRTHAKRRTNDPTMTRAAPPASYSGMKAGAGTGERDPGLSVLRSRSVATDEVTPVARQTGGHGQAVVVIIPASPNVRSPRRVRSVHTYPALNCPAPKPTLGPALGRSSREATDASARACLGPLRSAGGVWCRWVIVPVRVAVRRNRPTQRRSHTGDPTLSAAITDTRADRRATARRGRQPSPMPGCVAPAGPRFDAGSAPMTAPVDPHLPQPAAT